MANSPLDRLDPFATTGVGSLPMTDPAQAVAHVLDAYDVPFCPQLPHLDGDMVVEWLGGPVEGCVWTPERDRERPHAWEALLRALAAAPPEHRLVKLQATGPLTLCWALGETEPRPGFAREVSEWLAANAAGQVRALAERGLVALLVVDEPALGAVPPAPWHARAWDPLRAVAPVWGLHLCCAPPWRTLEDARPDVLSLDVAGIPLDRGGAGACARLIEAGTRIAWGVVASSGAADAPAALAALEHVRSRLAEAGATHSLLARASLLSPACGTGASSQDGERRVAAILGRTASAAAETTTQTI